MDQFLAARPLERGAWLVVGFGAGIAAWLLLPGPSQWFATLALCGAVAAGALLLDAEGDLSHLRAAILGLVVMFAAGLGLVWTKSALVGEPPLPRPVVARLEGRVLSREDQGAKDAIRLVLVARLLPRAGAGQGAGPGGGTGVGAGAGTGLSNADAGSPARARPGERAGERQGGLPQAPLQVRINLPVERDAPGIAEGALVRLDARLMPPAPPMLPGSYDFARAAWFQGLAATGRALGPVTIVRPAPAGGSLGALRRALSRHVRAQLGGSPGTIAAAFASGDRGAIAQADEDAMRDAGLTHLLSISGLHVSAVIAGVYALAIGLLALFPPIALRLRLPIVAATAGALAGIGYTLLTGAQVPTVRSCVGALLVLAAMVLGRDPVSLRLVAVAAFAVLLFWPEAVWGPSFQMSFASVVAIIAFHNAAPARRFLAPRDEGWIARLARHLALLLATGVVIELVLMPIAVFHFHRAGLYGALVNVVAIPLTTFGTMPLIALALLLDLAGWGAPAWYLCGKSLDLLLWLAHVSAAQPGAVRMLPGMDRATFGLFVGGLLWLALWTGRVRLGGLAPVALGTVLVFAAKAPDVLVSGDGHQVGIVEAPGGGLLLLREGRSDFARDALLEAAGIKDRAMPVEQAPGAQCNADFCRLALVRDVEGRPRRFVVLMSRGRDLTPWQPLIEACAAADIVIADRRLPAACRPRMLKADRALLARTGGLAIALPSGRIRTVAETQGHHGWYRWPASEGAGPPRTSRPRPPPTPNPLRPPP
ncbi:ComEC/Rec2 family competence protein [Novosphingobium huizhouense]|uniref:ComEC/Rec2 family competence protein n=1 Tax=Novosphingobium huizhouense TaxID=2866625 RepID=UPI001CD9088D|nr:ComEC/Rec2 family competence protein [Novosphingobium huizhouense]